MNRIIASAVLAMTAVLAIGCKSNNNNPTSTEQQAVWLDQCQQVSVPMADFYHLQDTVTLGDFALWAIPSFAMEVEDVGEYQFQKLYVKVAGNEVCIDSVLRFGTPSYSAQYNVLLIPILDMQYFDMNSDGRLLLITADGKVMTLDDLNNSVAACMEEDGCYWVSHGSLYRYDLASSTRDTLALFMDYGPNTNAFTLQPTADGFWELVYCPNLEEAVLDHKGAVKARVADTRH